MLDGCPREREMKEEPGRLAEDRRVREAFGSPAAGVTVGD